MVIRECAICCGKKAGTKTRYDRVCMAGAILLFQNSTGEKDTKRIPLTPEGKEEAVVWLNETYQLEFA